MGQRNMFHKHKTRLGCRKQTQWKLNKICQVCLIFCKNKTHLHITLAAVACFLSRM